jgi:hypothetical protein
MDSFILLWSFESNFLYIAYYPVDFWGIASVGGAGGGGKMAQTMYKHINKQIFKKHLCTCTHWAGVLTCLRRFGPSGDKDNAFLQVYLKQYLTPSQGSTKYLPNGNKTCVTACLLEQNPNWLLRSHLLNMSLYCYDYLFL